MIDIGRLQDLKEDLVAGVLPVFDVVQRMRFTDGIDQIDVNFSKEGVAVIIDAGDNSSSFTSADLESFRRQLIAFLDSVIEATAYRRLRRVK